MKQIIVKPRLVLYQKESDPENSLGLQLRVWMLLNGTEIVVRIENQEGEVNRLWDGARTNGDVKVLILRFLYDKGIIKKLENWESSASHVQKIRAMDEYEDSDKCHYWSFFVKKHLLKF